MGFSNQDSCDQEEQPPGSNSLGRVSCTTFNILAPIYKRLHGQICESEFRELWLSRNESILDGLLNLGSSIICLQEFWVNNQELASMYEKRLGDAGYATYKLARTNNRGDGLLTAVSCNHFRVMNYQEFLFNDIGDRVAQILHVELLHHSSQNQATEKKEVLIVNTHLIFPHDSSYCFLRLKQVYKILHYIESYCHEYKLPSVPVILCGDWNGSNKGNVYKFLQSQGFISSYDIFHPYNNDGEDFSKWISHRNHRGNVCGVDFVWFRNPRKHLRPLKESFMEAVLGNINNLLHNSSTKGIGPLDFLETDGGCITYSQLSRALGTLSLSGQCQDALSTEDMKKLWEHMDTNGDGVIDLSDFTVASLSAFLEPSLKGVWNPCSPVQLEEDSEESGVGTEELLGTHSTETTICFTVNKAMFLPQEVENGMWPENYFLSDHAQLTVEFSVVQLGYS